METYPMQMAVRSLTCVYKLTFFNYINYRFFISPLNLIKVFGKIIEMTAKHFCVSEK